MTKASVGWQPQILAVCSTIRSLASARFLVSLDYWQVVCTAAGADNGTYPWTSALSSVVNNFPADCYSVSHAYSSRLTTMLYPYTCLSTYLVGRHLYLHMQRKKELGDPCLASILVVYSILYTECICIASRSILSSMDDDIKN